MLQLRRRHLIALVLACAAAVACTAVDAAKSSCAFDGVERVVAVGDVHGAYDRYLEILRIAGIIDRGDDSRKVLDFLKRLEHDAPAGQVHILLGNHEVARMLGDLRLTTAGEYAAFAGVESENLRQRFVRSANLPNDTERDALMQKTP